MRVGVAWRSPVRNSLQVANNNNYNKKENIHPSTHPYYLSQPQYQKLSRTKKTSFQDSTNRCPATSSSLISLPKTNSAPLYYSLHSSTSSHFLQARAPQTSVPAVSTQSIQLRRLNCHSRVSTGKLYPSEAVDSHTLCYIASHVSNKIVSVGLNIRNQNLPSLKLITQYSDYNGFSAGGSSRQNESQVTQLLKNSKKLEPATHTSSTVTVLQLRAGLTSPWLL